MELEIIALSETSYFYKDQHGKLSFLYGFGSWSRRGGLMGCGGGKGKGVLKKMMGWWIWSQDMKDICEAATISALNTRASILKGMSCKCFLWTWSACFCQPHCPREKFSFHLCPMCHFTWLKTAAKYVVMGGTQSSLAEACQVTWIWVNFVLYFPQISPMHWCFNLSNFYTK